MDLNKSESTAAHIFSSTYKDKAGYTNLDKPSTLESKAQPITERPLCNQQLKIDFDFSTFGKRVKILY